MIIADYRTMQEPGAMEFLVKLIAFLFMAWLVVMLVLLVLSAIVSVKRAADRTFEQLRRRDDGDPDP